MKSYSTAIPVVRKNTHSFPHHMEVLGIRLLDSQLTIPIWQPVYFSEDKASNLTFGIESRILQNLLVITPLNRKVMLKKRLIFILFILTIISFSFSQVTLVTADTSFAGKAKVWYFSNVIVEYPDISENQMRQKAENCLSGAFLFKSCVLARRAKHMAIIYDMGYLYQGGDLVTQSGYMPNYFNYSEAWKHKERKLEFMDGAFEGVIEALYYGFDY